MKLDVSYYVLRTLGWNNRKLKRSRLSLFIPLITFPSWDSFKAKRVLFLSSFRSLCYGFTMRMNGAGTGTGAGCKIKYKIEMFTLVGNRDRNQNPLFPIVPVVFPVPVPFPFLCSVTTIIGRRSHHIKFPVWYLDHRMYEHRLNSFDTRSYPLFIR